MKRKINEQKVRGNSGTVLGNIKIPKEMIKVFSVVFFIVAIFVSAAVYIKMNNIEYINGSKALPFELKKTYIVTTAKGERIEDANDAENDQLEVKIVDDMYLEFEDLKGIQKISKIKIFDVKIENEYKEIEKIKILPIDGESTLKINSEKNSEKELEKLEQKEENHKENKNEISDMVYEKKDKNLEKFTIGFRIQYEKIENKKIKKDTPIKYGLNLIDEDSKVARYNLSNIKYNIEIEMENGEKYIAENIFTKTGTEKKDYGFLKEILEEKIKFKRIVK